VVLGRTGRDTARVIEAELSFGPVLPIEDQNNLAHKGRSTMRRRFDSDAAVVTRLAHELAMSASPVVAVLDLVIQYAAEHLGTAPVGLVLGYDHDTDEWTRKASTAPLSDDEVAAWAEASEAASASVPDHPHDSGWHRPQPIDDGRSLIVRLYGGGHLVGALLLLGCTPGQWEALDPLVSSALVMGLANGMSRQRARAEAAAVQRSARAIRRLFEEGAGARDIEEAGAVLARVAAEAFETERAGMYVVDGDGIISFAVGVGVSQELSDALAKSLVGRVAAQSPVWRALERVAGPDLVDDASAAAIRPGGFVQTLGFVSYAAIPLLSKAGPLGMVICGDASRRRRWTQQERELAGQFALEGTLIVDAARLRQSERAQLAQITHQAFHDGLTGVANRALIMQRMDQALATARPGTSVALLLLDLDDFKQVNDTLGHRYGDELLGQVASRLARSVRSSDTVARLGGDEFAVLLAGDAGVSEAAMVAAKIQEALAAPIRLSGISLTAVASIGIAVFPAHASSATDLLQRADIAMYSAKRSGGGTAVYDPAHDDSTVDKLTLYTELRRAIDENELRLLYQPKLDLARDEISGVEALVRWQHPRRGLVPPSEFLPVAESTGLIHPLTAWVMRTALQDWARWAAVAPPLDLSVNVSVRNLLDRDLLRYLAGLIAASDAAEHLVLEVTETAVMFDPKESSRALRELRELGVRVSLDDFGTGYSSLTQLRQLPVDELKIDRHVVAGMAGNDLDGALVETIIALAHRLDLSVVAEGIEDADTVRALRALDCDFGQGYFISRPVPADQIAALAALRTGRLDPDLLTA
jgi:diguanylate cyclase (GGDEF)-like protein